MHQKGEQMTSTERISARLDALGVDPEEVLELEVAGKLPAIETGLLAPVIDPESIDRNGEIHIVAVFRGTAVEATKWLVNLEKKGFHDVSLRSSSRTCYILNRKPVFA